MWVVRQEKYRTALARRTNQCQNSPLRWWTGRIGAASSSSWPSFLEIQEALRWVGLSALRGVVSMGRDFYGGEVHLSSCHPHQHSDSAMLVFPLNLCNSASATASKVHSFSMLVGLQKGRKGVYVASEFVKFSPAFTALHMDQVFLSHVCSGARM